MGCLGLGVASVVWLMTASPRLGGSKLESVADAMGGSSPVEDRKTQVPANAESEFVEKPKSLLAWEPTPWEVLANPDCGIAAGWDMPAGDVALVVVPGKAEGKSPAGSRFAVLDDHGTLFAGELPFKPNHWRLGRRDDGGVVTAFADRRRNSKVFRPRSAPEPFRVYLDGGLTYESAKAWDFDVADDGSSFFVVEPMAGEEKHCVSQPGAEN